ncbi:hypothetical protein ANO11243_056710 [Dothideomycetidae sp. 11243]|nr:hypothetical protein ANO11243_056710 [fungal sp. No.11243]
MNNLDARGILAADPRPTAVIDLHIDKRTDRSRFSYLNDAWKESKSVHTMSQSALSMCDPDTSTDTHTFWDNDVCWFAYTVLERWRVLQCVAMGGGANAVKMTETMITRPESDLTERPVRRAQALAARSAPMAVNGSGAPPEADGEEADHTERPVRQAKPLAPRSAPSAANGSRASLEANGEKAERLLNGEQAAKPGIEAAIDSNQASEELDRLLQMIQMSEVGIFEYNMDGLLVQANEAFYTLSGHPRKFTKESHAWVDSAFEEDLPGLFDKWNGLAAGNPMTFQMRWKRPRSAMPDGQEDIHGQWVNAACVPIKDNEGKIKNVAGCLTDIAHHKRSEQDALQRAEAMERAAASERRFSRFAELANVAMWIMDPSGRMQYCNLEWFKICGLPVTDPVNVSWQDVLPVHDLAVADQHWKSVTGTQKPTTFEVRSRRPRSDSSYGETWFLVSAYAEVDSEGRVTALAGTLADISSFKWAEQIQQTRLDEAIEAKRQQENFIDITSHEIRNPLGAVIHCADSVLDVLQQLSVLVTHKDVIQSGLDAVQTIITCCIHQQRIIEDTLTMSKLDSKLLTILPTMVDPLAVLEDIQKMFFEDTKKAGIDLRIERQESLSTVLRDRQLMLDKGRLMQVLINLVTNAIKFTGQEMGRRRIIVSMGAASKRPTEQELNVEFCASTTVRDYEAPNEHSGPDDSLYLSLSVTDTGCGMDRDQLSTIFSRFSQGSPRTYSKYGGSGLGLFISRELTELQGGEIGVSSTPGAGACFAFFVKARVAGVREAMPSAQLVVPVRTSYAILVVEDNIINQKVLRNQLSRLGHQVSVASNGQEALDFMRTTRLWHGCGPDAAPLDVILMDIEMPVMNGLECARSIRNLQATACLNRHIAIIAVSANARDEQVQSALDSGMDDTISKPFRVADLMPKVHRLVDRQLKGDKVGASDEALA